MRDEVSEVISDAQNRLPNKEVTLKPGGKGRGLLVSWEGCVDSGRVGSVNSKLRH